MSEYDQPWRRVTLGGQRCKLQVLDLATAFDLEPELMRVLGDVSSLAIVAPGNIGRALLRHSGLADDATFETVASDPVEGQVRAVQMLQTSGELVVSVLMRMAMLEPRVVWGLFERMIFERLEVDGEVVADGRDWMALGWSPRWKWHAMAQQLRNTFGPLWTRSPYELRSTADTLGVPEPKDVPIAVRYAAALAREGYATSPDEVLRRWTPVRVIEVIESAAFAAEQTRRANDKARAG